MRRLYLRFYAALVGMLVTFAVLALLARLWLEAPEPDEHSWEHIALHWLLPLGVRAGPRQPPRRPRRPAAPRGGGPPRRAPVTAAVAVVTLGLGIGGNTAAFTWASALLLRPYDFADLEALVTVWERHSQQAGNVTHHGRSASDRNLVAPADFLDLRQESRAFRQLAAYRYREHYLVGGGEPERIRGLQATSDLLPALGVAAALGRTFLAEEGRPGRDQVALLGDGFWRRRFAADPGVLGREITLGERTYTVVGVLPADLTFPVGSRPATSPPAGPRTWVRRRRCAASEPGRLASPGSLT